MLKADRRKETTWTLSLKGLGKKKRAGGVWKDGGEQEVFGKGRANLSLNPGSASLLAMFLDIFSTESVTIIIPTS